MVCWVDRQMDDGWMTGGWMKRMGGRIGEWIYILMDVHSSTSTFNNMPYVKPNLGSLKCTFQLGF